MVSHTFEIPLERIISATPAVGRGVVEQRIATRRSFVGSDENRLVPIVMQSLLDSVHGGTAWRYSPLLICGSPGTGKSLLAHCLAGQWFRHTQQGFRQSTHGVSPVVSIPGAKQIWMSTGADFARSYGQATKDDDLPRWRERCRSAQLFVLDDLQHLQKRFAAQRELVLLLDDLEESGIPAILTSPTPAAASDVLYPQLASRLSAGLTIELQPPGAEARYEILLSTIQQRNLAVAESAVKWFAERFGGTVPSLQNRLLGCFAILTPTEVAAEHTPADSLTDAPHEFTNGAPPRILPPGTTATITRPQLRQLVEEWELRQRCSLRDITRMVSRYCQVSQKLLLGTSRKQDIVLARSLAMYIAKHSGYSLREIGHYFSGRDHSTVLHACQKMSKQEKTDPPTRLAIDELRRMLANEVPRYGE